MADSPNESPFHQEMIRRSQDLLRVYNPTDKDYLIEWDKMNGVKLFRVRAKQEEVLIRYIAEKYINEMYQKILADKAREAIYEENQKRIGKGMAEMDRTLKTGEQMRFESKFYNLDHDETSKIISLLYLGVDREFGIDEAVAETSQNEQTNNKTTFQQAFETVEKRREMGDVGQVASGVDDPKKQSSQTKKYVCEYPGCNFSSDAKIGLSGHKRSHRKEAEDDLEKKKAEAARGISK